MIATNFLLLYSNAASTNFENMRNTGIKGAVQNYSKSEICQTDVRFPHLSLKLLVTG